MATKEQSMRGGFLGQVSIHVVHIIQNFNLNSYPIYSLQKCHYLSYSIMPLFQQSPLVEEITTLESNHTCTFVLAPLGKSTGCCCTC